MAPKPRHFRFRVGWQEIRLGLLIQIRHHELFVVLGFLCPQADEEKLHFGRELVPEVIRPDHRFAASRRTDDTGFVPNFDILTPLTRERSLKFILDGVVVGWN